jgi:prophage antirepressor-like protein
MQFFNFDGKDFKVLRDKVNTSWWVGKELCDYLDLKNPNQVLSVLPDNNKQKIKIDSFKTKGRGGDNGIRIIINEPGLYWLVARSNKPEALKFQAWIYDEVIPSIRATGSYSIRPKIEAPKAPPQQIPRTPKTYKEAVQHLLVQIEENPVTYGVTIDETNLVNRISMVLNAYRRQKNRLTDLLENMKKIVFLNNSYHLAFIFNFKRLSYFFL